MLMQAFKSAADLGITEPEFDALRKTLVLMETGKLNHKPEVNLCGDAPHQFSGNFNMNWWSVSSECGTVCCMAGTAELIGGLRFDVVNRPQSLTNLFYPNRGLRTRVRYNDITPEQAATALRSYLTTGEARWDLAFA